MPGCFPAYFLVDFSTGSDQRQRLLAGPKLDSMLRSPLCRSSIRLNSASLVLRFKCSFQCTSLRAFIRRNDRQHVSIISGLVSIARIMSWGSVLLRVQNIIIISLCYLGTHDPIIMAHAVFAHYLISFHSFLSLNGRFGAYSR